MSPVLQQLLIVIVPSRIKLLPQIPPANEKGEVLEDAKEETFPVLLGAC